MPTKRTFPDIPQKMSNDPETPVATALSWDWKSCPDFSDYAIVSVHKDGEEGRAVVHRDAQCRHPIGDPVIPSPALVTFEGAEARLPPCTFWQYFGGRIPRGHRPTTHRRCGCF